MQAVDLLLKLEALSPEKLKQQIAIEFNAELKSDEDNTAK